MKTSNYNVTVDNGTENILYNTLSRKYVVYASEKKEYMENLLNNLNKDRYELEEAEIIKKLALNGLVVDDNMDELSKIKFYENKAKFQSEIFYLVIQPTLNCNFRCVYCYEEHRNIRMNDSSRDSLVEFVKGITKKVKTLCIAWFGGEPMMEFERIKELTRHFQDACKENGCDYIARMTSNAYLFSDESINMLESLAIQKLQITLDGTKETHDLKRPLANGEGTFNKVMGNLIKIIDKDVTVTLRVNVDEKNIEYIPKLFDMIPEDKRSKVNLNICNVFQNKEKLDLYELYKTAVDKGFRYYNTSNTYSKCEGNLKNSFTVQPDCRITPCSICAEKGFYYGKISEKGELRINNKSEYFKFHTRTVFDNERCIKCIDLPMCMGGCACARYKEINFCTKEYTHEINLNDIVKLHYHNDLTHNLIQEVNVI